MNKMRSIMLCVSLCLIIMYIYPHLLNNQKTAKTSLPILTKPPTSATPVGGFLFHILPKYLPIFHSIKSGKLHSSVSPCRVTPTFLSDVLNAQRGR